MTREEIKKKIADMETGLKELKEELEKAENTNSDVFIPGYCEEYWCITCDGDICRSWWDKTTIDKNRLALCNVFRTSEEAKFEIERLKVLHELRQYAVPRGIKLDGTKKYFHMIYDFNRKEIIIAATSWWKEANIYFSSENKVWEAIKEIGEDKIKKYYFCI